MQSSFSCSTAHPTGWLHLLLPPLGGRMWVQLLFVSLTASCANTAVMSWGERRLITDCSVFLPVPLGEPYTVNWTTTPRELNCWWDRPLPHENSIIYQKTFLISHMPWCTSVSQHFCLQYSILSNYIIKFSWIHVGQLTSYLVICCWNTILARLAKCWL